VRGSPLIRFIAIAFALMATGFGLMRMTAAKGKALPTKPPDRTEPLTTEKSASFELTLSAPAAEIEIDTGKILRPSESDTPITGTILLDAKNPHIRLKVTWKNAPAAGERRFAKILVETAGQDAFTHVFDSAAGIDDFVELPLK
jgi:hypothetical protein